MKGGKTITTPAQRPASVAPSLIESIGHTPLYELRRFAQVVAPVRIFGKAEFLNPGGSVKDRAALSIIRDGERSGRLTRDKILLDATSGNTGIAYAMIGAALGYGVKLAVPANMSLIRKQVLEAFGAELVITQAPCGSDGAILEARRLIAEEPHAYFYADQYNNPANWQAHYHGTAEELIEQTGGALTHLIAGLGTSGTLMGAGRRLKEFNPAIQAISFQPDSPMHGIEGLKHMPTAIVPGIYDPALADQNFWVRTEEAQAMVKRVAREEGLLVGLSAGAALHTALRVAQTLRSGYLVVILCDTGQRYLDMTFWNE